MDMTFSRGNSVPATRGLDMGHPGRPSHAAVGVHCRTGYIVVSALLEWRSCRMMTRHFGRQIDERVLWRAGSSKGTLVKGRL